MKKYQCSFYLRWPDRVESPIYAYATFNAQRLRFSTGVSIPVSYWDSDAQKVRTTVNRKSYPQASDANAYLERVRAEIGKVLSALVLQGTRPTPALLTRHLDTFRVPMKRAKEESPFLEAFEKFIAERKKHVGERRISNLEVAKNHLNEFGKKRRVVLSFETLTASIYEQWLEYLYELKISPTTARNHAKALRTFCRWANDRGLCSVPYTQFKLPKINEAEIIALTEAELAAIAQKDLSDNQRLAHARDIFLIQCYSGLRFSDAVSLSPENIDLEGGFIRLTVQKTEEPLRIPITEPLRKLLLAYELNTPRITNQEMNRSIKNVAFLAELKDPVRLMVYEGRTRKEKTVQKWRAITSHTGRKTFCTLSLLRGAMPDLVMKVSGHTDHRSFKRYIEITDKKTAEEMHRIWGGPQ